MAYVLVSQPTVTEGRTSDDPQGLGGGTSVRAAIWCPIISIDPPARRQRIFSLSVMRRLG